MPGFVDKLMARSVAAYLGRVRGVPATWFPTVVWEVLNAPGLFMPRELQNLLFDRVLEDFGVEALEAAPGVLAQNPTEPLVFALLNVDTPLQAIEKLIRLKRYLHSFALMTAEMRGADAMRIKHYFKNATPHPGEHIYTFGAVRALLTGVGCQGIEAQWCPVESGDLLDPSGNGAGLGGSAVWEFRWRAFLATHRHVEGLDAVLLDRLAPIPVALDFSRQLSLLIRQDLSERWTLAMVARRLGVSVRTLQRRLQVEGTRFSTLVAQARLEQARYLLARTQASITEIGFSLGYADNAHFSRDFKRHAGTTPSQYRRLERGE